LSHRPGRARHFNPDEVEVIRNRVNRWVELEPSVSNGLEVVASAAYRASG
jgi:hypothetical protein